MKPAIHEPADDLIDALIDLVTLVEGARINPATRLSSTMIKSAVLG